MRRLNDELVSRGLVKTERPAADDSITKACNYINNHLGDDFTYRDVADFVHLSPRHFIRRFRSEMNETFTDYLIRMRIEGAMRLMDEEEWTRRTFPRRWATMMKNIFSRSLKREWAVR